jgi:hypothetical protein
MLTLINILMLIIHILTRNNTHNIHTTARRCLKCRYLHFHHMPNNSRSHNNRRLNNTPRRNTTLLTLRNLFLYPLLRSTITSNNPS